MYELGMQTAAVPQLAGEILAAGTAFTTFGMIWLAVNAVLLVIISLVPDSRPRTDETSDAGSETESFRQAA